MAGDWIKMRTDLKEDPAVYKIAEILNIDELQAIGALFCFWAWADKHCVDGRVDGATSRLVDRVSLTNGFADALSSVGWLSIDDSGIQIPKFERHNGDSAKARMLKTERQAKWRLQKDGNVDAPPSTQTSTDASTREEKRREEIKELTNVSSKSSRKRSPTVEKPDAVCQQVWDDWLQLRKAKKAPVTDTVVSGAVREADKAGMTLENFLRVWCSRGSQGLEASWLKPNERISTTAQPISFAEQDRQAGIRRWEEMTGRIHPDRQQSTPITFDMEAADVFAIESR